MANTQKTPAESPLPPSWSGFISGTPVCLPLCPSLPLSLSLWEKTQGSVKEACFLKVV